MLALAEFQVKKQQLDWAFCDTDSMALANVSGLSSSEFKARALAVVDWFAALNPYGESRSILQLEKVNIPIGRADDLDVLEPPECLAISAKRYVLFNRRENGPEIRKASGHGLGHLMAPYDETSKQRRERIDRIGVPLWQEDVWKEIIRAADTGKPDETRFIDMVGFDSPAASQYAATTPELLRWFASYNERMPKGERVFPFGFLLSLQSKSQLEMAKVNPAALSDPLWFRREPRPAAPYFKRPTDAPDEAFDRERGTKIPSTWLKSLGRSLVRYHLHEEMKFGGGEYEQRGELMRRHVVVLAQQAIGKEADHIEESEFIGEGVGPEEYPQIAKDREGLLSFIAAVQKQHDISDRVLCMRAHVSRHTLAELRDGKAESSRSLRQLVQAAEELRREAAATEAQARSCLENLRNLRDKVGGRNKLAKLLGVSAPYLGRVLRGKKLATEQLVQKTRALINRHTFTISPTPVRAGQSITD
jgi:transcriptional regulator with XRE-family HTH domain